MKVVFLILLFCISFAFASTDCGRLFTKDYYISLMDDFLQDGVLLQTVSSKTSEELDRAVNEFLMWWQRTHPNFPLSYEGATGLKKLILEEDTVDDVLTRLQKELAAYKSLIRVDNLLKLRELIAEYTDIYWAYVVLGEYRKRVLEGLKQGL